MHQYLESTEFIDWSHPRVLLQAKKLAEGCDTDVAIARRCFEFVRDEIKHSGDFHLNPVTYKASDVLIFATGYCYAKSLLLAALLRANGVPAGLCYQRISINGGQGFCLHGLNAAHLNGVGWFRFDARGDKPGVSCEFSPPLERVPFSIQHEGEFDCRHVFVEPLQVVIDVLKDSRTYADVSIHLPDLDLRLIEPITEIHP